MNYLASEHFFFISRKGFKTRDFRTRLPNQTRDITFARWSRGGDPEVMMFSFSNLEEFLGLEEFQRGFVLQGLTCTRHFARLQINQLQIQASQFDLVLTARGVQTDHLRFAGLGSPVQKLQFGIASRNTLGIDRTARILVDLQEQNPGSAGFNRNLLGQIQEKGFAHRGTRSEAVLGLGEDAEHEGEGNQNSSFHASRLNV